MFFLSDTLVEERFIQTSSNLYPEASTPRVSDIKKKPEILILFMMAPKAKQALTSISEPEIREKMYLKLKLFEGNVITNTGII